MAEALSLARSAGATVQVANNLMALGGWRARLPEATTRDVFGPLLESVELWERLRIPWGRVLVLEEIAQALAIRGHPEQAVVLFAAVDAGEVQAPAKVGRERRAGPHLSGIDEDDLVRVANPWDHADDRPGDGSRPRRGRSRFWPEAQPPPSARICSASATMARTMSPAGRMSWIPSTAWPAGIMPCSTSPSW